MLIVLSFYIFTAFAELQTDLGELVTDETLDIQQLPFHDFPTYATKVFFPSASTHHPVLQTPRVSVLTVFTIISVITNVFTCSSNKTDL